MWHDDSIVVKSVRDKGISREIGRGYILKSIRTRCRKHSSLECREGDRSFAAGKQLSSGNNVCKSYFATILTCLFQSWSVLSCWNFSNI